MLGLYQNPPENALVLCVDEKSRIQALDRTQPLLSIGLGKPKRQAATWKCNGTTCLLAALAVHARTLKGRCFAILYHEELLEFLRSLYRRLPRQRPRVIVDKLAVHKLQVVMA